MLYHENLYKAKTNGSRSINWQGGEPTDVRQLFFLLEWAMCSNNTVLRKGCIDLIEEMARKKWEIIAGKLSSGLEQRNFITLEVNSKRCHLQVNENGYLTEITKPIKEETKQVWTIPVQINVENY